MLLITGCSDLFIHILDAISGIESLRFILLILWFLVSLAALFIVIRGTRKF